jgi:tritrans,polycis-undecaprenyl-diphosphate synthase [geranylgeranyl-diphosphate specific]
LSFQKVLGWTGVYKAYEMKLRKEVDKYPVPAHIAIMLDGNRRWATQLGLDEKAGHDFGARKAEELLDWCLELDIRTVTLYVLSTENLQRERSEVDAILSILDRQVEKSLKNSKIHRNKVRVKAIGRIDLLPEPLRAKILELEKLTQNYTEHYLNLAIAYGSRAEIIHAMRAIMKRVESGEVRPDQIDEKMIEKNLYTGFLPDSSIDLLIRTSGEQRLSNFLLWQTVGAQMQVTDVYWPEFRKIDLLRSIRDFQRRAAEERLKVAA